MTCFPFKETYNFRISKLTANFLFVLVTLAVFLIHFKIEKKKQVKPVIFANRTVFNPVINLTMGEGITSAQPDNDEKRRLLRLLEHFNLIEDGANDETNAAVCTIGNLTSYKC